MRLAIIPPATASTRGFLVQPLPAAWCRILNSYQEPHANRLAGPSPGGCCRRLQSLRQSGFCHDMCQIAQLVYTDLRSSGSSYSVNISETKFARAAERRIAGDIMQRSRREGRDRLKLLRYLVVITGLALVSGAAESHGLIRSTDSVLGASSPHLAIIVMENK